MKQEIKRLAEIQKISRIGFCRMADYYENAKDFENDRSFSRKKENGDALKNARTAIVCAFSYYCGDEKGNLSRYARGEDYHKTVMRKMAPITELLRENGYFAEAFADIGIMNERLLAVLSGIAFIGRNRMAINEKIGSYFFIGYILTDCELEPDRKNCGKCADCGRCREACPLGALDRGFDESRCVSYITQKKGDLSEEEQNALKKAGTIWGCDICQEVCPHNVAIPETEIDEFKENLIVDLEIDEDISDRKFREMYKNRAFSWRGKGVIARNLKILKKK